ncbi:MAG: glycosyltransferase [Calditrichia bacterium]
MKIIMVDSLVDNDYAICLCDALQQSGADVSLVVTENRRVPENVSFDLQFMAPSKAQGISKISKLWKYFRYLYRLRKFAKSSNAAAIHFQFFRRERLDTFYFVLLRLLGYNVIHTAHNVLPHERSRIDFYLKYLVYLSARQIVVHSGYIRDKLLASFRVTPGKVHIIPHGNFDMYVPEEELTVAEARSKINLPESAAVVLCFGHIREYKGIDILIQAFDLAAQEEKDLHLIIAGSARTQELKERYCVQIDAISASDRVQYVPDFIPNEAVAEYFTAADIIALPYRAIDHSGIVHLAYSFGKPIIATRVGDFSEAVEEGKSGFLVEKEDAKALAEALRLVAGSKGKLVEMGEYAQMLNKTKYSWQDIARKTRAIYK